ncbi:MAG: PD-(D/E)XK nuclease family protein [bacterium]
MSEYYNPQRSKNLYDPISDEPFKISRSKIDLFIECPRCFYLDRRLGVGRPPGFPFNLNSAVDALLKKEFDIHRAAQSAHPLFETYGIDAVPFQHAKMNEWRENFKGIQYLHKETNLIVTGAIDDIWVTPRQELIVVDYKSTSKNGEITIDAPWQMSYKRQMEVYQWLFRQNGFTVCDTGYFVYCNGDTDKEAFDAKLEFDIQVLPYQGDTTWIDDILYDIHECLVGATIPQRSDYCDYCRYYESVKRIEEDNA